MQAHIEIFFTVDMRYACIVKCTIIMLIMVIMLIIITLIIIIIISGLFGSPQLCASMAANMVSVLDLTSANVTLASQERPATKVINKPFLISPAYKNRSEWKQLESYLG